MRVIQASSRLSSFERGEAFQVIIDGKGYTAYPGETVATVLLAAGIKTFRHAEDGSPRGLYCGIGQCFSCLVTIDGNLNQRACVTQAAPGMNIQTSPAE